MRTKLSERFFNFSVILFLLLVGAAQFYGLYFLQSVSLEAALADGFGSLAFLFLIFLVVKYIPYFRFQDNTDLLFWLVYSAAFALVWVFVCRYVFTSVFYADKNELSVWQTSLFARGLIGWLILYGCYIVDYLVGELRRTKAKVHEEQQTAKLRKDAELFKLRQQLQPHFLFNSLNSINALIGREPRKARQMVQQLSDYLRNTLKKEDDDFVSFQNEMNDLRLYLAIEQVRFGHRLNVEEKIEPDCEALKIPPFLLQPLVENAIKYGLYGTTGVVSITISAQKTNGELAFSISNPFDINSVMPHGTGFGLDSVRRRLYLLYARNDLLKITKSLTASGIERENELQIFTANLIIPLIN
jgi:two-component sensor histidine kinase